MQVALVRLPLAAVLGAALAMRPKRRGTPPRTPAVIQTQIILSIVGAVIMLVVGASLARAFGIVGAANLIRYRSKIDDPKDAVVMLCTLSVGLAAGVGLYALAVVSDRLHRRRVVGDRVVRDPGQAVRSQGQGRQGHRQAAAEDRSDPQPLSSWSSSCAPRRTRRSATMSRCRSRCRPIACPTPSCGSTPRATPPSTGPRRRTRRSEAHHPAGRRPHARREGGPERQENHRHRDLPVRSPRARESAQGGGRARRRRSGRSSRTPTAAARRSSASSRRGCSKPGSRWPAPPTT